MVCLQVSRSWRPREIRHLADGCGRVGHLRGLVSARPLPNEPRMPPWRACADRFPSGGWVPKASFPGRCEGDRGADVILGGVRDRRQQPVALFRLVDGLEYALPEAARMAPPQASPTASSRSVGSLAVVLVDPGKYSRGVPSAAARAAGRAGLHTQGSPARGETCRASGSIAFGSDESVALVGAGDDLAHRAADDLAEFDPGGNDAVCRGMIVLVHRGPPLTVTVSVTRAC